MLLTRLLLLCSSWIFLCTAHYKKGKYDNIKAVECVKLRSRDNALLCVSAQEEVSQIFAFIVSLSGDSSKLNAPVIVIGGGGMTETFSKADCFKRCISTAKCQQCADIMEANKRGHVDGSIDVATFFKPRPYMLHTWPHSTRPISGKTFFDSNVVIGIRSYYQHRNDSRKVGVSRFIYNGTVRTVEHAAEWVVQQSATTAAHNIPWVLEQRKGEKSVVLRARRESALIQYIHKLSGSFKLALQKLEYDLPPEFEDDPNANINSFSVSDDECVFLVCSEGTKGGNLIRTQVCEPNGTRRSVPEVSRIPFHCHTARMGSIGHAVLMTNSISVSRTKHYVVI